MLGLCLLRFILINIKILGSFSFLNFFWFTSVIDNSCLPLDVLSLYLISVFDFQGTFLQDLLTLLYFQHSLRERRLVVTLLRSLSTYGDGEIRTLDPLLARQVLSQLSYAPGFPYYGLKWTRTTDLTLIRRAL